MGEKVATIHVGPLASCKVPSNGLAIGLNDINRSLEIGVAMRRGRVASPSSMRYLV